MIKEIVVSTIVASLAFLSKFFWGVFLHGLPETHAIEGRAALRDALEILNLVEANGGFVSEGGFRPACECCIG